MTKYTLYLFMWLCIASFSGLTTVFCIVLTCVSKKSQYKTILLFTELLISENLLVTPIKQSVFWSYLIGVMLDFLVMIWSALRVDLWVNATQFEVICSKITILYTQAPKTMQTTEWKPKTRLCTATKTEFIIFCKPLSFTPSHLVYP